MTEKDLPYKGPEQRAEVRRTKGERRQEIRFEPEKKDRRQNPGRRKSDKDNNLWRQYDT